MNALALEINGPGVPGLFSVALPAKNFKPAAAWPARPGAKTSGDPAGKNRAEKNSSPAHAPEAADDWGREADKSAGKVCVDLKPEAFQLKAPFARSVKLAAEFTEWAACALDMIRSESGAWFIIVPLPLGQYAYRFIVDGQWQDDPHAARHVPNPYGGANAVHVVS
jgi:1,4-alpha-glucan branching enzyme